MGWFPCSRSTDCPAPTAPVSPGGNCCRSAARDFLDSACPRSSRRRTPKALLAGGRAKSVIFLFLFGGPSQLETFDMKPDAKREVRGPFQPIRSRTPDLMISEHLGRLANISEQVRGDPDDDAQLQRSQRRGALSPDRSSLACADRRRVFGHAQGLAFDGVGLESLSQKEPGGMERDLAS